MEIQDTKTWNSLDNIDKIEVYDLMRMKFIDKVIEFPVYLLELLIYYKIINKIKSEIELKEKK